MNDSQAAIAADAATKSAATDAALGIDRSKRSVFLRPLFLITVAVPTLLAILYFGFFADSIYTSESRFLVRSPARSSVSPLGAILTNSGLGGTGEEASAVIEYIESRDALNATDGDGLVRNAFGPKRAGFLDRFGGMLGGETREHLYKYFQSKVEIRTDPVTQVAELSVRAFNPQDAQTINQRLLEQSEKLVNQLAERSRKDAVDIARAEVDDAQIRARKAAVALANFRNQAGILDPEKEAEVRLQMISKLQDELISTRIQLQQMEAFTPRATQIPFLRKRVSSLDREIADQTRRITGTNRSLSASAVQYQALRLDTELSEKLLATTLGSLEEALGDARRKNAYVQRIAAPSLPDYATEPRRVRGILSVILLSLLLWGVLSTLLAGIKEHRD